MRIPDLKLGQNVAVYNVSKRSCTFFVKNARSARWKHTEGTRHNQPIRIYDDDYLVIVKKDGTKMFGVSSYPGVVRDSEAIEM